MPRVRDLDKALSAAQAELASIQEEIKTRDQQALTEFAQSLPAGFAADWKALGARERTERAGAFAGEVASAAAQVRAAKAAKAAEKAKA